jgi:Holliday junction resolvase RusA-like endonuclease
LTDARTFAEIAARALQKPAETSPAADVAPAPKSASSAIVLRLERPFSTNAMYRSFGRAGKGVTTIKSKAYRDWTAQGLGLIATQKFTPVTGSFGLQIKLPKATRIDIDNSAKAFLDLLRKAGVIVDDAPRYMRRLEIIIGLANHTTITIKPLEGIYDDLERQDAQFPIQPAPEGQDV